MNSIFKEFESRIHQGIEKKMPIESKLIILGKIYYATERGDLTIKELEKLENELGIDFKNYHQEIKYTIQEETQDFTNHMYRTNSDNPDDIVESDENEEITEKNWLHSASVNLAFDFLNDPEEDIYTLADGKPFHG